MRAVHIYCSVADTPWTSRLIAAQIARINKAPPPDVLAELVYNGSKLVNVVLFLLLGNIRAALVVLRCAGG